MPWKLQQLRAKCFENSGTPSWYDTSEGNNFFFKHTLLCHRELEHTETQFKNKTSPKSWCICIPGEEGDLGQFQMDCSFQLKYQGFLGLQVSQTSTPGTGHKAKELRDWDWDIKVGKTPTRRQRTVSLSSATFRRAHKPQAVGLSQGVPPEEKYNISRISSLALAHLHVNRCFQGMERSSPSPHQ